MREIFDKSDKRGERGERPVSLDSVAPDVAEPQVSLASLAPQVRPISLAPQVKPEGGEKGDKRDERGERPVATRRFRLLAGPNGSGKTTLKRRLESDYAVNFYDFLNADEIFAEAQATGAYLPRLSVEPAALAAYAEASSYGEEIKRFFREGMISVADDCVRFVSPDAVNSYTVALLTNFLQAEHVRQGVSFSQESVFSHSSKIEALAAAKAAGFRTYLYFVATDASELNVLRVAERAAQGGHAVPAEKIRSRYARSLSQIPLALKYLDRAFFFDNGDTTMRYLASWNPGEGLVARDETKDRPAWFAALLKKIGGACAVGHEESGEENARQLAASAAAASQAAVARTFAAGHSVAVLRGGRLLRLASDGSEEIVEDPMRQSQR